MNTQSYPLRLAFCVVILLGLVMLIPGRSVAEEAKTGKTLDNLQAAYNGESNANAKYLAYAVKAEAEGFHKVARLFRAAASAEEVHLKNHAEVIKGMGATPMADIKLPEVKSTKENLADAIKGESYEQITMYPEFITLAEKENNPAAVNTFTFARDAEAEHAKLYKKALSALNKWKKADVNFYVCPICGYTVEGKPGFANCPLCGTPAVDYLVIS
jgi:rubrerythrin